MINCQSCKQPPKNINDMISCQNPKCLEYDLKYHVWEWQALNKDIETLAKLEEDQL